MLYRVVKFLVSTSLRFFSKEIRISDKACLEYEGPLLLACNHPNSFLDAMIVGRFMKHRTYFMTRGDVFKKQWVRNLLSSINMIPIFRIRDGKDKLSLNDETFTKSVEILRNRDILLIFVEGFCEHQTELQLPLKKGAPRILQSCWQEGIPVKVLPVWLEYSSFDKFGKTIDIRFGELFGSEIAGDINHASCINKINTETTRQLLHLSNDYPFKPAEPDIISIFFLLIPAMLGAVLHAPLYIPVRLLVKKLSAGNVHYDAMLLAFLLLLYPIYLLLIAGILFAVCGQWWAILVLLIFPLTAKAFLHWKK